MSSSIIRATSKFDLTSPAETTRDFVERPLLFADLLNIFPDMDILVYTPDEFERQMELSSGFWAEFKKTARRIL